MKQLHLQLIGFSLLFLIEARGINAQSLATVTTNTINGITATSAFAYGNVINNGGDPNVISGICYSTSPAPTTVDSSVESYYSGTGSFTDTIYYLSPNTKYYVRAYAINGAGTAYGSQMSFTTGSTTTPVVTTDSVNGITATTAFVYGTVTNDGNDPTVINGICYSTSANPTISDSTVESYYSGAGPFADTIYYLSPNTKYYVRAYATTAAGTAYGSQKNFTTGSATTPQITTDSINGITATTAFVHGTVTNDGNDPTVISGICYSTSPNPTKANDTVESYYSGAGPFADTLYFLNPNTKYYVRAYATTAAGTAYGSQMNFTTGNATLPVVTTDSVNGITATTAFVYGNVTNNGNDPDVISGVCYSTYASPTILGNATESYYYGSGSFADTIYSLSPNTTYYARSFAINAADTVYGNQLYFTTGNVASPVVTTDSINNSTATTVFVYGNVTNNGNDPDVISGFYYGTSANLTTSYDSTISYYQGAGPFADTVYGLSPNTKYYIMAYATNAEGTSYGSTISFTTGTATSPTVTTDSINTITATTADAFGTVTNDGNDPDAISGFCYSTSPNPTVATTHDTSYYSGSGAFTATLPNLNPLTTYYLRAYVTNAFGTSYGSGKTFTTGSATSASVTTDSVNGITATSAFLYGNVTNNGNDPNVLSGFCYSTSPNPTVATTHDTSYYSGSGVFSDSLYNLNPNTTYYIRAYASNILGVVYGIQKQFTTDNATLPAVVTDSVNDITDSTAFLYGNVINDGNDPFAISGFCIGTSPNPTIATADTIQNSNEGAGAFYIVVYPLAVNTYYYVTAFSSNIMGTSYGKQIIFKTGLNTGIEQINGSTIQLNLSPNPTNSLLNINFVSEENSQVEINLLNALGVTINLCKTLTAIAGKNSAMVDLSSIASGVYFIQIKSGGVVLNTQKVIKTE